MLKYLFNFFVPVLFFCLSLVFPVDLMAQASLEEAKAAYLLAEEEFNAGKYQSAISYLDMAQTKLGTANAKISYLKVVILEIQARKDDKYLPRLKEAIEAFEKAPDHANFNDEKRLEVLKLKLKLARPDATLIQEEDLTPIYQKFQPAGWRLGLTIDEARALKPDFFAKAKMSASKDGDVVNYSFMDNSNSTNLDFKKGKLNYILLVYYVQDENKNFTKVNALKSSCMSWFTGTPVESRTTNSDKTSNVVNTSYTWKEGKVLAMLSTTEHAMNFGMGSRAYSSHVGIVVSNK